MTIVIYKCVISQIKVSVSVDIRRSFCYTTFINGSIVFKDIPIPCQESCIIYCAKNCVEV